MDEIARPRRPAYPTSPKAEAPRARGDAITGDRYWSQEFARLEWERLWTRVWHIAGPQGNPCGKLKLKELPCGVWGGFVFYSFDPSPVPLLEFLDPIPELLAGRKLEDWGGSHCKGPSVNKASAGASPTMTRCWTMN